MKKIISIIIILLVFVGLYFVLSISENTKNQEVNRSTAVYSSKELGIEFTHPVGQDGYVLEENTPAVEQGLLKTVVLIRAEDVNKIPVGGEGPATITLNVFKNLKKQWPRIWADEHVQSSNINLKVGDVLETTVGGANAIRYKADGLYASDTIVVAHGENIYVIRGMYIDENSLLRMDFSPIVQSIRFIPQE